MNNFKVNNCRECPFSVMDYEGTSWCQNPNSKLDEKQNRSIAKYIYDKIDGIPEFCPLISSPIKIEI